jgi:hypothetical protein
MRLLPPADYAGRERSQNYSKRRCNHDDPKADKGGAENAPGNFREHAAPLDRQNESIGCSPQQNSAVKLKRQRKLGGRERSRKHFFATGLGALGLLGWRRKQRRSCAFCN